MASAYWPRHNKKPKHPKQQNLTPNKTTNHLPINRSTHTYLTQLEITTLVLPNRVHTNVTITTPKIYNRINPIIHNKIQHIPQYTSSHIKCIYHPLQMYHVHSQHKYHPTLKTHTKQKNSL